MLVSHEAKVNQADGEGITPLFVACLEGSLKMVEYLIEVGANVGIIKKKICFRFEYNKPQQAAIIC